jgi:hypothetical protein
VLNPSREVGEGYGHHAVELPAQPDRGLPHQVRELLDEFSAVATRTGSAAAGLAEQTRSVGVALVFGAPSLASLGDHAELLMANVGTTVIHRVPLPQPLLELAGATDVWEDLHQTGASGLRIASGGRRQQTYRIPPDLIRSLPAGQAVIVRQSYWGHVAVAKPAPQRKR